MSTITSGLDTISQDWVQKFHFENKVDLSLQTIEQGESGKIEIDEIPTQMFTSSSTGTNTKSSADSYLQSILSSTNSTSGTTTTPSTSPSTSSITATCTNTPTCTCYKCQRQKRRAGLARAVGSSSSSNTSPTSSTVSRTASTNSNHNNNNNSNHANHAINNNSNTNSLNKSPSIYSNTTTATKINTMTTSSSTTSSFTSPSPQSSVTNINTMVSPVSPPETPIPSPQQTPKRANTLRKTPTLRSYDRHMPKPTYSQHDSIYRVDDIKQNDMTRSPSVSSTRSTTATTTAVVHDEHRKSSFSEQTNTEGYKISWKEDDTGDDILPSLVTFHTIFEEKGDDSTEGLSDLLEARARQLRDQKLREKENVFANTQPDVEVLPPRLKECLTLSYRIGPKHNALTLYHTMKMRTQKERLHAYDLAFKHCVNADSGLRDFVKKERKAPIRESSKLIQPAKRPHMSIKRTLLHPLGGSRKNKLTENDFIWSASSDNLVPLQKRSIEVSSPVHLHNPTDVVAATQALVPNAYSNDSYLNNNSNNSRPYEYIDIPSRPRATDVPNFKDTSSISSNESYNNKTKRPNRLFSSLARKTSIKSHHSSNKATSIGSIEKPVWHPDYDRVLDELCRLLPHIDRPLLASYVIEANGDYKTALQLCRSAVMSGKLT